MLPKPRLVREDGYWVYKFWHGKCELEIFSRSVRAIQNEVRNNAAQRMVYGGADRLWTT